MSDPVIARQSGHTVTVTLNRANVHNAFDEGLIAALIDLLKSIDSDPQIRAVILTGTGSTFSAGADLNWMRKMADASEAENLADSLKLAELMRHLHFLSKPTIARVNGSAYGGGVGLIACCDIAIGISPAKFSLSEVKLGLIPAVISPYVIAAIGARQARKLFQTAEVFDALVAEKIGLLHDCVDTDQLDEEIDKQLHYLSKGGPIAQQQAKQLVHRISGLTIDQAEKIDDHNAALIARLRVSAEGQKGLAAFLDKRSPDWMA